MHEYAELNTNLKIESNCNSSFTHYDRLVRETRVTITFYL